MVLIMHDTSAPPQIGLEAVLATIDVQGLANGGLGLQAEHSLLLKAIPAATLDLGTGKDQKSFARAQTRSMVHECERL